VTNEVGIPEGVMVVIFLEHPKEKVWGMLNSISSAGIVLRGLDITSFEDWMRQEGRDEEKEIGPYTLFFPMHRVVRVEQDETVGPVLSYAERFLKEVGRSCVDSLRAPTSGSDDRKTEKVKES
jgi:hypothetical protein